VAPAEFVGPAEPSLRILHVCAPAQLGGLERVIQALAVGTAELGHPVGVATITAPGTDLAAFVDPISASGVHVHRVEVGARSFLSERGAVERAIQEGGIDVLHTHGYRSDLLHGYLGRRSRIPVVSTLHGSSRMGGASHLFERLQLEALRSFDATVAVSRPLVEELVGAGVPTGRIHFIRNPWSPPSDPLDRSSARAALGLSDDGVVIGWVGRMIPVKGCDLFLESLSRLEPLLPDGRAWRAVVIGDGPESEVLQSAAKGLGLSDRVRFAGALPEAARFMRAFDLFVLSSRSEGTPMVLLEAMGAGIPVVAFGVGGVPDVIGGEGSGWIVPPENPDRLADAIREALEEPGAAALRAERARGRLQARHDLKAWARRHVELYEAVVKARRR
jgi:glycosyltransferase involved in cell wall biosynthesis